MTSLPGVPSGLQFDNMTTVCYMKSSPGSNYLHSTSSDPASLSMGAAPSWINFSLWAFYRFRLYYFSTPKVDLQVALRNEYDRRYILEQTNLNSVLLTKTNVSLFSISSQGTYDLSLGSTSTSASICSSGNDVVLAVSSCVFTCYPRITFYSSDVVTLTTANGKTLLIIAGQILVLSPGGRPPVQQQFRKKRQSGDTGAVNVQEDGLPTQLPPLQPKLNETQPRPGETFIMYQYKYDMGDEVFHAATFLNVDVDRYLTCNVNPSGDVTLGYTRPPRDPLSGSLKRPERLIQPDSRMFILERISRSEVVLRCHQDPELVVSAQNDEVYLSKKENHKVFTIRGAVSDIQYDEIEPVREGDNTKEPCTNNARPRLYTGFSLYGVCYIYFFLVYFVNL